MLRELSVEWYWDFCGGLFFRMCLSSLELGLESVGFLSNGSPRRNLLSGHWLLL